MTDFPGGFRYATLRLAIWLRGDKMYLRAILIYDLLAVAACCLLALAGKHRRRKEEKRRKKATPGRKEG